MFKAYFKTALRNLKRNKIFSFINIAGLTIGLCACMLVATVVIDDLSYDRQWSNSNNLYRIISVNKMGDGLYDRFASSLTSVATTLQKDYPEVKTVAELSVFKQQLKMSNDDANGVAFTVLRADTSVWQMLDFSVLAGNPKKFIDGTGNIVLSQSIAKKFFPNQNPVGKIIYDVPSYSGKAQPYVITGVVKDMPQNTVLRSQVLILQKNRVESLDKKQSGTYSQNYILMQPGTNMSAFATKFNKWYAGYMQVKNPYQFEFQPMKDVYLHSDFAQTLEVKESYSTIFILSGVALLLLIIACINFINLSTARAIQRVPETSVRKILGAARSQIIVQLLAESILFFGISTVFAFAIYQLSLPAIENFLGYHLTQTFLSNALLLSSSLVIIFLVSIMNGLYPAWIISGFKPSATLKGKLFTGKSGSHNVVRKSLVVLQFALSIVVFIAMMIMQQQVSFMKHKDIGFDKNNLLYIGYVSWDGKGTSFKNELLKRQGIETASITEWTPASAGYMTTEINDPNHAGNKLTVWYINGDLDFAKTLGLHLQQGRFLNASYGADAISQDSLMQMDSLQYATAATHQSSIITGYTSKLLHVAALNQPAQFIKTTPVGLVDDFNTESLQKPLQPTIVTGELAPAYGGMLIRIKPGYKQPATASINKLWRQFYADKLLDLQWVDDMMNKEYRSEIKLQQLFIFFSGLSMLLAAMGIFGLVIQATAQRIKEIGIRKVLGASVQSIVRLFYVDFLKLILIAIVIASPVAWFAMSRWLQDFAYRTNIHWWVFATAGLFAVVMSLITVSFQTIKAAIANPVKSLRTE